MEFFTTSAAAAKKKTDCAIVGVFKSGELSPTARALDEAADGLIAEAVEGGDLQGALGDTLLLRQPPGLACRRLLLVGCGPAAEFGERQYRRAIAAAVDAVARTGARDAISYLSHDPVEGLDAYALARHGVAAVHDRIYRFDDMKSETGRTPPLGRFGFSLAGRSDANRAQDGVDHGAGIVAGVELARHLGNLPPNVCNPTYLAERAREIGKEHKAITTRVVSETEMRKLGMGALLSVTAGTTQPAQLIIMQYRGAEEADRPIVLVGKGVTFDSGGISLKQPPQMDEMKFDMGGAAAVMGAIVAAAHLELPLNVTVVVPAVENLPSGTATRPGDIVRSLSGQTVEILNTDAEGRLILCDSITYARRFKPDTVIDVATLTGACVIALGYFRTGLMTRDEELAQQLLAAGDRAGDTAWRLPLDEDYGESLKSNFADFANVGGKEGGAITAGCFLARFTEGLRWAHLDCAGTAWKGGKEKGATGRPVGLLAQFLIDRAAR